MPGRDYGTGIVICPMVKMMLTGTIYSMYCTQMEEEASHVYIRYPLSTKIEIVPGERYRLSNRCTDAGLNQTERYHPILCVKEKADNVVVITQSYKNDVETFRNYTKHLRKWLDGDIWKDLCLMTNLMV